MSDSSGAFDPASVNLDEADAREIICYLYGGGNDYNGMLGARVSAIFVILVTSSATTLFPVIATRTRVKIPLYVYLFARYFGAGVIVATAFIHLLDPAYEAIGPSTCVGMTGGWALYPWPAGIALASSMILFLIDFVAARVVEKRYGLSHDQTESSRRFSVDMALGRYGKSGSTAGVVHQHTHAANTENQAESMTKSGATDMDVSSISSKEVERGFHQQFAAFLILEFGVIFHSVVIGLTLGSVGDEFSTLYPVIVFHQAFEGLGVGARLSAIPFPFHLRWLPWALGLAYGLTTPIAIAIGLGVRTSYHDADFTASVVSGVLDAISAGILMYTGFVELLARDFIFERDRERTDVELAFMTASVFLGALLMALLGKWA